MSPTRQERRRQAAEERLARAKDKIHTFAHVCRGTLAKRTTVCGKPSCRCAKDPRYRHGPYYEWSRWQKGRLVSRRLSPEQAAFVREAIASHRTIQRLLRTWEAETVKILEATIPRK